MQVFHQDETDQEFPSLAILLFHKENVNVCLAETRLLVPACGTIFRVVICPDWYSSVLSLQEPPGRVHPLDVPISFCGFRRSHCPGCSSNAEHRCGQQPPHTARQCW